MKTGNNHSAEIKTEVLQICEAFNLGSFKGLLSFEPSSKVAGYILTQFETSLGSYEHYFRIKEVENNASDTMDTCVRSWYISTFPNDELGVELNWITFGELSKVLDERKDVYAALGVGDSLVRERVFQKLAEIMNVEYRYVYEQWLKSA
jgi:hypothetical protein